MKRLLVAVALAVLAAHPAAAPPQAGSRKPPIIAAAANLNVALPEIAEQFARQTGTRVELEFGASGTLTRQIRDGAPFEMFLAADEEFPNRLTKEGMTKDPGVVYAVGRLAIFAPTGSPLTVDERLNGLAKLAKAGGVTRFAIANPEVAPYGRADTVSQAAQFATTGNAVGGLIALSLVLAPGFGERGSHAVIPEADHESLRQRMVLLKNAGTIATAFYSYIQAESAQAVFRKHGYGVAR